MVLTLLGAGGGGAAAPTTPYQITNAAPTAGGGTTTLTYGIDAKGFDGMILVAFVINTSGASISTLYDSVGGAGAPWTAGTQASISTSRLRSFTKKITYDLNTSDTITVTTATNSTNNNRIALVAFPGMTSVGVENSATAASPATTVDVVSPGLTLPANVVAGFFHPNTFTSITSTAGNPAYSSLVANSTFGLNVAYNAPTGTPETTRGTQAVGANLLIAMRELIV